MISSELRIGNWINAYHGNVQVVSLGAEVDNGIMHTPNLIGATHGGILSPIPLTPEILEQFGFIYEDGEDSFYPTMTKGNFTVNFAIHNGTIQYYGDRIINTGGEDYLKDIVPVHRFQNIYHSLTGEDLTLNLTLSTPDIQQ